jgi:hypothetical protein
MTYRAPRKDRGLVCPIRNFCYHDFRGPVASSYTSIPSSKLLKRFRSLNGKTHSHAAPVAPATHRVTTIIAKLVLTPNKAVESARPPMPSRITGLRPYESDICAHGITMRIEIFISLAKCAVGKTRTREERHCREDGFNESGIVPDFFRIVHNTKFQNHLIYLERVNMHERVT